MHGSSEVYFLRTTTMPEICLKNKPLTFRDVQVLRLSGAGSIFELGTWSGENVTEYSLSVVEGVLSSTQLDGAIY